MSVSGVSLLGVTQDEAADAIRNSGENVTMVIARNPYPEDDQVHFGFFRSIYYLRRQRISILLRQTSTCVT